MDAVRVAGFAWSARPRARGWLLFAGGLLTVLANFRFGLGVLGWFAPASFLLYLRGTSSWRSRLAFAGTLAAAWTAATAKIAIGSIPLVFVPIFSLPCVALQTPAYMLAVRWMRGAGPRAGALVFATLLASTEWLLAQTPMGTWGALGYTQAQSLVLMQIAAYVGLFGLSACMYFVAALLVDVVERGPAPALGSLAGATAIVVALGMVGAGRLGLSTLGMTTTRLVAAVGTDSPSGGFPPPARDSVAAWNRALLERTRVAAARGAEVIVWTECATVVFNEADERALVAQVAALARELDVHVVAAWLHLLSVKPPRYENKYVWLRPDGLVDHTFLKHHLTPGEPATPDEGAPAVVDTPLGRASGGICFDFDFPAFGTTLARSGVDLVALPSSDWRGIDPVHTEMAAFRAVEGGMNVIRSTRFGRSAAIDSYGRMRAWQSSFEEPAPVLLAALPTTGVTTVYEHIGDTWLLLALLGVVAVRVRACRIARATPRSFPPPRPAP